MKERIAFQHLDGFHPIPPTSDLLNYFLNLINAILNSDSWHMEKDDVGGYTVTYESKRIIEI